MKEKHTVKLMHVSEFANVRSKKPEDTTLEAFFGKVREGTFRRTIEVLRHLHATPGKEEEAHAVKGGLPCIVPAGTCSGGHAVSHLLTLSGVLCVDLDHTDSRTGEVKMQVQSLPWVCGCFVSPSGNGVKIFVRVHPEEMETQYPELYAAVGEAIARHVSHPYDEKCRILTQPCFCSYDPEAFFRPEAEPFSLSSVRVPDDGRPMETTHGMTAPRTDAPGFIAHFLHKFERENPFARGERNSIALKLGRTAAYHGFTLEEVDELLDIFIRRYSNADFTASDIRERVLSGYQFVVSKEEAKKQENYLHFTSTSTMEPVSEACVTNLSNSQADAEEEAIMYHNNQMRSSTPCLPEEVFADLPSLLTRCVCNVTHPRDRDTLLLGSLCSCSALLPHVRFLYRQTICSPHFYLAVVAPAGTGKGVLAQASALLDATQDYYDGIRKQMKNEHEKKMLGWTREQQNATREKRDPDFSLKPEDLRLPFFKISPNTSKSRFLESLAGGGEVGCCMFSTEMTTLSSAIGQDYGHYDDILLKAFHHEEITSSYKIDGDPIVVRRPHLSLCLSGTQEQFCTLFQSLETGLFSRFAFYTRPQELIWDSCEPDENEEDQRHYFHRLGEELLVMHRTLLESPTLVTFTKKQWEQHTEFYSEALRKAQADDREATGGIIFRNGLIAMRIAAILTAFRKWDDYRYARNYLCSDTDFRSAMNIAHTLLEHSLLLSTSLPASLRKPVPMRNPHRLEKVLSLLPDEFTYTLFYKAATEEGVSRSSALRMLHRAVKLQLIVKEETTYCKLSPTPEIGS